MNIFEIQIDPTNWSNQTDPTSEYFWKRNWSNLWIAYEYF